MRTQHIPAGFLLLFGALSFLGPAAIVSAQSDTVAPSPRGSVAGQVRLQESDTVPALDCQGCHTPQAPLPYLGGEIFHRDAHSAFDISTHARAGQDGKPHATCLQCHSTNGQWDTVFPSHDSRSSINRIHIATTCGACHQEALRTFRGSIHGQGQERGISAAATCSDCHGAHAVLGSIEEGSPLSRQNTAATCAKCHEAIYQDFQSSAHAAALRGGDKKAPVCTTCHTSTSHAAAPVSLREFDIQTVLQCVRCHEKQGPSYRDTFHGQAIALGFKPAATCADCHTPHRNLPSEDVGSSVNSRNLVGTCGRCHQNATASFVTFDPHSEPANRERSTVIYAAYLFMSLLFVVVFGFFGLHTILWLQRSIVGLVRGEGKRIREGEQWVRRFNRSHRVTHVVVVVSFLVLAATGLPLMYNYTEWGQVLVRSLGGLGVTRFLHRAFAIVTFGYAFYHLGYLGLLVIVRKDRGVLWGPESMMPRRKDFEDLYHMFRWFLYLDGRPPRFDRWTYWEKFDYFAVFWGVPIIGLSGLVLWFPAFFSGMLPGYALNVAMIVHSEEALLATGFIFAFHFFHNHMRPENFPLDTVIFTGRLPLERFVDERPAEYERLVEADRLGEVLAPPPSARARLLSSVFGYTAYIVGLVLVIAIFATLLKG